jgi:tripartite-type tricarboxylate transporter receptor subunit TctC
MSKTVPLLLAAMGLAIGAAASQAQPIAAGHPVSLFVGFAPGGPADTLARILAEQLQQRLGQPVVVQNKPGAGGTIAAAAVAKAAPDGTTLLLVTSGHAGAPALYRTLPFDAEKDFTPIIALAESPVVILVNAKSPYRTLGDLLEAMKRDPGKLNFGTGGGGATLTALAAVLLRRELGFQAEGINFPGSGPANLALTSDTIDFSFDIVSGAMGLIAGKTVRALAVTSAQRSAVLPDVPTIAETVKPGFEVTGWFGLLAPAGVSAALAERLNRACNETLGDPSVRERLAGLGIEPVGGTAQQFANLIGSETVRWGDLIWQLGLKPE